MSINWCGFFRLVKGFWRAFSQKRQTRAPLICGRRGSLASQMKKNSNTRGYVGPAYDAQLSPPQPQLKTAERTWAGICGYPLNASAPTVQRGATTIFFLCLKMRNQEMKNMWVSVDVGDRRRVVIVVDVGKQQNCIDTHNKATCEVVFLLNPNQVRRPRVVSKQTKHLQIISTYIVT